MKSLLFIPGFATNESIWELQLKKFKTQYANLTTFLATQPQPHDYVLIGWSLGGIDAIKLYFKYPDKIKGLVLVSSFAKFLKSDDYPYGLNPALMKNLERKLKSDFQAGLEFFYDLVDNGKGLMPKSVPIGSGRIPNSEIEKIERLKTEDARSLLPKIKIPVLLIHGDRDQISPIEQSKYMKEQIPNAELIIMGGTAHAPFLENPQKFNNILREWLERI